MGFHTNIDPRFVVIQKTADGAAANNTTVKHDDEELKYYCAANEKVHFRLMLIPNTSAVADMSLCWTYPVGGTGKWTKPGNSNGDWGLTDSLTDSGVGGDQYIEMDGYYFNGATAGYLQLTWAQAVAEVSDTKVKEGSILIITRL